MRKRSLTAEEKRLDTDLWIIGLVTLVAFLGYVATGERLMDFVTDGSLHVLPRLLVNAAVQFGVAGLGITIVCILRKESFTRFGLRKENTLRAVVGTVLCFAPLLCCIVASGQFHGYHPFTIMITADVLAGGLPLSLLGMALIAVVWGFFEGFNYAVISEKINCRYPSENFWLDYGAITCAVVCVLFHPMVFTPWGIVEMATSFAAIYGMLLVKKRTGNAWGCVFAFCFIWNAI